MLSELGQQRFVQQVLDVLVVVERGRGRTALVGALLVGRFAWVDSCNMSITILPREIVIALDPPFKIHSRRKSDKVTCSFFSA